MIERYVERVHSDIVLDIGQGIGALVIYTKKELRGRQIDVSLKGDSARKIHTDVLERRINGRPVFAAVFPTLPEGEYTIWSHPSDEVTIAGGAVAELDWSNIKVDVYTPSRSAVSDFLPPRYHNGNVVSAAPMGTATMRYTDEGQVAWDQLWTDFCDLALAGGPPHRDSLLEPASPDEVRSAPEDYERVVAEIERGLNLVTGLPIVRSEKLGWVGLRCADEEMALWMLRAIVVENVCVRREGSVLFFPAGPGFRLEKEIKNVVTVVAKTHHYWTEHCFSLA